ncbi:integral membrane protein [Pantoea sp. AS-PWVM4]|uniref:UbiA family prenyltransferase n=1 Tax=Pantoea sp. AS-PWVM4 TaxID=1332069 RepID=UPI0003AC95B4|nr:UbiA family prenyltransferase [Pantoea sp. AS-PWVM4]ERK13855.1 integral membrane protein [Pantoea sp. AS-PWVM4]
MIGKPLVVDLDGTLIHSDMLHESALRVFRDSPFETLRIPFLLLKGKACLKQHLASRAEFTPKTLPYNEELLEWLKQQREEGRYLVLCTASDKSIADRIAEHLGIFDEVIASDGVSNIAGEHKAAALVQRFQQHGYDYAGNSSTDLPVWSQAHKAIVVNGSNDLVKKAQDIATIERVFPKREIGFSAWRRMLRIHQWLKNLLLLVPLFAAHDVSNGEAWLSLLLAFIAFSLCASSVYIANDLLDLDSDRLHPRKRNRPFASGLIPAWIGVLLAPLLLIISLAIAGLVGKHFLFWLLFYFALTCAYSWLLKRLMLVDCLTLAMLYTLRIVSGAAAVGHDLSFWLLAFSVFLFLSLAFVKRYAELELQLLSGKEKIHGRGYHTADAPLIQTMGIVAGYSSVLVLALYLNSDAVLKLYAAPELIWGAVPVMLFWVSWMWMQAHRGKMHDDPLVFAVKDRASLSAGIIFAAILVAGTVGVSW